MKKTYSPKAGEVERRWWVVDATDQALGRMASEIARILMGKHKPTWAPHIDTGDFVIVVNADRVTLSGRKEAQKIYYRHSGRPGSLRQQAAGELREKRPVRLVELAVERMLPKNSVGRKQARKLKVYAGPEHPHQAQQPEPLEMNDKRVRSAT